MTTSSPPHILVFDSGLGGLSVFDHICHQVPSAQITYVADHDFAPYGERSAAAICARIPQVLAPFSDPRPDLLVLACNTASTVALATLRQQLAMPIVGVVPAIKPAAALSRTQVIGLIATPLTCRSSYVDDLQRNFAPNAALLRCGSTALVQLAEAKMRGQSIEHQAIVQALAPLLEHPQFADMDVAILGCTHFPLLAPEISKCLPGINMVDSGAAIGRRVAQILAERPQLQPATEVSQTSPRRHRAFFSALVLTEATMLPALVERNFATVAPLPPIAKA